MSVKISKVSILSSIELEPHESGDILKQQKVWLKIGDREKVLKNSPDPCGFYSGEDSTINSGYLVGNFWQLLKNCEKFLWKFPTAVRHSASSN